VSELFCSLFAVPLLLQEAIETMKQAIKNIFVAGIRIFLNYNIKIKREEEKLNIHIRKKIRKIFISPFVAQ